MPVFVIFDLMGAGRMVGIFDSRARAEQVIGAFPQYYKMFEATLRDAGPEGYAVVDTSGMMRLVGVFATEDEANQAMTTSYHSLHKATLNEINPAVLDWTISDDQRRHLLSLMHSP